MGGSPAQDVLGRGLVGNRRLGRMRIGVERTGSRVYMPFARAHLASVRVLPAGATWQRALSPHAQAQEGRA